MQTPSRNLLPQLQGVGAREVLGSQVGKRRDEQSKAAKLHSIPAETPPCRLPQRLLTTREGAHCHFPVWPGAAPCPLWASVSSSGLYHRGLWPDCDGPTGPSRSLPSQLEWSQGSTWGEGEAWGPSQRDSPLIRSKDASPQGGGRLGPDIKGPAPLALSWEPCKVIGNMRTTLCPSPKRKTWENEKKKLLAALDTGFG